MIFCALDFASITDCSRIASVIELKVAEENLIINILEEKNTLLKKSVKIEVINYNEKIKEEIETLILLLTKNI